jgi:hypothetical protein
MPTVESKTPVFQAGSSATLNIRVVKNGEAEDVSAATRKNLIYIKPRTGERVVVALSNLTDGADGWLTVTFTPAQIQAAGSYPCQLDLKYGDWDGPTKTFAFECLPNL